MTESTENIDLFIRYEGSTLRYSGYLSFTDNRTQSLSSTTDEIHVTSRGNSHFMVLFRPAIDTPPEISIQLNRQNKILLHRNLILTDRPAR
jgi:hypothetical protein